MLTILIIILFLLFPFSLRSEENINKITPESRGKIIQINGIVKLGTGIALSQCERLCYMDSELCCYRGRLKNDCAYTINNLKYIFKADTTLDVFSNGRVVKGTVKNNALATNGRDTFLIKGEIILTETGIVTRCRPAEAATIDGIKYKKDSDLILYGNGRVDSGDLDGDVSVMVNGSAVLFYAFPSNGFRPWNISFYENGNIKEGFLAKDTYLMTVQDSKIKFRNIISEDMGIAFTIDGKVKSGRVAEESMIHIGSGPEKKAIMVPENTDIFFFGNGTIDVMYYQNKKYSK